MIPVDKRDVYITRTSGLTNSQGKDDNRWIVHYPLLFDNGEVLYSIYNQADTLDYAKAFAIAKAEALSKEYGVELTLSVRLPTGNRGWPKKAFVFDKSHYEAAKKIKFSSGGWIIE